MYPEYKMIAFSLLSLLTIFSCAMSTPNQKFSEKDLIWKSNRKVKRQAWNHWEGVQNDGQLSPPVQPIVAPVLPPMRTPYCDPEVSTIGKRSIQPLDSFPNLNNYFLNEETSDVHLLVNGTKLPAHKFVLRAKSPKFDEMFRADPLKQEFDLGLESEEEFKTVLKYFYTERFELNDETDYKKAIDVYKMAQRFAMDGLKLQIERSLAKMIFIDNYLDIYKFAEENQMYELVRLWMNFVFANSQQIIGDESFMNETVGIAEKVLTALNVAPSYVIIQMKKLIEANPDLDINHFRNVIHIERCSVDDLVVLAEMKIFDHKFLFEDMHKRYRVLSANCNGRPVVRHVPRWTVNN